MVCYKTSRDYKRLRELLDAGYEVVCFTTYDFNRYHKNEPNYHPVMTTDVCRAKLVKGSKPEYDKYLIGVRGCTFIDYWINVDITKQTFEEECESEQIEFIEPTYLQE
jgi:hypothetical protein